ncbi:MAG: hypothetical protein ACLPKB_03205 [Xanthobacteraceae bacterium]
MFADPMIRDAFLRAERDQGDAFAVPAKQLAIVAGRGSTRDQKDAPSALRKRLDLPMAIVVLLFMISILLLVLLPGAVNALR